MFNGKSSLCLDVSLAASSAETLLTAGGIGLSLHTTAILTASYIRSTAASTDLLSAFLDTADRLQICATPADHDFLQYRQQQLTDNNSEAVQRLNPNPSPPPPPQAQLCDQHSSHSTLLTCHTLLQQLPHTKKHMAYDAFMQPKSPSLLLIESQQQLLHTMAVDARKHTVYLLLQPMLALLMLIGGSAGLIPCMDRARPGVDRFEWAAGSRHQPGTCTTSCPLTPGPHAQP